MKARRWMAEMAEIVAPSNYRRRKDAAAKYGPRSTWPKCGARTRKGRKCKAPPARNTARDPVAGWYQPVPSGRCRLHGGLSTGPKTEEGRRRLAEALRAHYDAAAEAQGNVRPSAELQARLVTLMQELPTTTALLDLLDITRGELRRLALGRPESPAVVALVAHRLGIDVKRAVAVKPAAE